MDPEPLALLREGRISPQRLGDLGLGAVGITLNPHFILDRHGARTPWLAKRLRSAQYEDPAATWAIFERDHAAVLRYFAPEQPSMVADTAFVVLDRPLDDHADHRATSEYVMVQEYVEGISLEQAAALYADRLPPWLRAAYELFVSRYRTMQADGVILDCFSPRSDHVKVDVHGRRVVIIDTNNLVVLADEARRNPAFCARYAGDPGHATAKAVDRVLREMQARGEYDPEQLLTSRDASLLRDARALEHLRRYFPPDGTDNFYLRAVVRAFAPSPGQGSG